MKTVIMLSGGQDSVTLLGALLERNITGNDITAISFLYNQRHSNELYYAQRMAQRHNITHHCIGLSFYSDLVTSNLTNTDGDISKPHSKIESLPSAFVPNRNALFITLAHALAQKIEAESVIAGVCQTDFNGFPDCRSSFIESLQIVLNNGAMSSIQIKTPLMFLTKAETFYMAEKVGFLDEVLTGSLTCYEGKTTHNEWGLGCGECPNCLIRKEAWEEYKNHNYDERKVKEALLNLFEQ